MSSFSDRIGATKPATQVQVDGMSPELRNSLWNWFIEVVPEGYWSGVLRDMFLNLFRLSIDDLPDSDHDSRHFLSSVFQKSKWYEVYNVIEYFVQQRSVYWECARFEHKK